MKGGGLMKCPECGEEITACPSCGGSLEAAGPKPEETGLTPGVVFEDGAAPLEEGTTGSEGDATEPGDEEEAAVEEGLSDQQLKIRRHVLIGTIALVLIGVTAIILAFAVLPGHDKGSKPSDTIDSYFKALQENRQLDALNLYDPSDLEMVAQMYGMTLDQFKTEMGGAGSDASQGSVTFENLAYEITVDGDNATAQITSGTVIMLDATGQSESQDMAGTTISMVKKDNKWYLRLLGDTSTQGDTSSVDDSAPVDESTSGTNQAP
jgi:hypothetical protein